MKKNLKSISIISALILLIMSVCVIPASASEVSYSVSSVSGATGDTVTVNVSLSTSVELWGANVSLGYNSADLEYVSSSLGGAAASGSSLNNTGSAVLFSGMFSAKSGTVFSVTFKILKESGSSVLSLSSSENTDVDGVVHTASASNGTVTVSNKLVAEKITLDKTSLTLKKGESGKLTAAVTPSSASKLLGFYSSDDDIATVSDDGTITAVAAGTATITAYAGDITAKCTVTVTVAMTGIKASGNTTRNMKVGDKVSLSVIKVPADATDNVTASWTSSDPEIASVKGGVVTAVAAGETTVTAKAGTYTVTYKIIVADGTETTTAETTTEEESSTEESTTAEESTTEVPVTFPTTTRPFTENTTKEEFSLVEPSTYENTHDTALDTDEQRYILIIAAVAVCAIVAGAVALFMLRNKKSRNKKLNVIVEEKFR